MPAKACSAKSRAATRPSVASSPAKLGTKAALNAPSPNRRRNRLGRRSATKNASATGPAPSRAAISMSRAKPSRRLARVQPPTVRMPRSMGRARKRRAAGLVNRGPRPGQGNRASAPVPAAATERWGGGPHPGRPRLARRRGMPGDAAGTTGRTLAGTGNPTRRRLAPVFPGSAGGRFLVPVQAPARRERLSGSGAPRPGRRHGSPQKTVASAGANVLYMFTRPWPSPLSSTV